MSNFEYTGEWLSYRYELIFHKGNADDGKNFTWQSSLNMEVRRVIARNLENNQQSSKSEKPESIIDQGTGKMKDFMSGFFGTTIN